MKIALLGATGRGGSCILKELVDRGHQVTAIARDVSKVPALPGVTPKAGDVNDSAGLKRLIAGHDAVISAVQFVPTDSEPFIATVRESGVPRFLVMGGAAGLETAPGVKLIDSPDFPPEYEEEARKAIAFLKLLKQEQELDWTYLSPALLIEPGERTTKFRVGGDQLMTDEQGESRITFEDFAIALVDELESHAHPRARISIAY